MDFHVVETISKPLLSAETCEKLGLFKLTISDTVQVNSVGPVSVKMSAPLIRGKVLTEYKDVFDCLGHIGDSSSFTIDPNYPLVQHVLRYILVTLQKKKRAESTSWISSMVVLENPEKIICLDPQDLNKAIQRPKYQMPTLEEILPKLSKAKVFTTLDAKDCFYQIGFEKETSRKTTFWTPFGRYRYLTMPFGINLTPKEFNSK